MSETIVKRDRHLVQELAGFVATVSDDDKQTPGGNTPEDVVISPVETVEEIKQFFPAIEKAFPLENVAGENRGTLWIQGSFYGGDERKNEWLDIGAWLTCWKAKTTVQIKETPSGIEKIITRIMTNPIHILVDVYGERPAELYAWYLKDTPFVNKNGYPNAK
jgi:hypothetical protein